MGKRRQFTDQFKAKVALEVLSGDKSVQEIVAKQYLRRGSLLIPMASDPNNIPVQIHMLR